jgi:hypothetical protein
MRGPRIRDELLSWAQIERGMKDLIKAHSEGEVRVVDEQPILVTGATGNGYTGLTREAYALRQ